MALHEIRTQLQTGKGSLRCDELIRLLESLGFSIKRRGNAQHYVYSHSAIPGFHGANFACPHRRGAPVKRNYITSVLRVLSQYETELEKYLGEVK